MPFSERAPEPESPTYERDILGFCNEMLSQASLTVRSCEGYSKIEPTYRAILGSDTSIVPRPRSETRTNDLGGAAEVLHAHLTDNRLASEFRTYNEDFQANAEDFTKMWRLWFLNNAIDVKFGSVIDYAIGGATGYAHQVYNKAIHDLDVVALHPADVRPVDPFDTTIQSCYGAFVVYAVPLTRAQAMFPHVARQLEQDSVYEPPARLPEITRQSKIRTQLSMSPFESSRTSEPASKRERGIRVVHLHWFYYNDPTTNGSKEPKLVGDFDESGEPLTNYSYIADPGEALYPRKRLTVHSKSAVCYDGPNQYIHGMIPVSKYTISPHPIVWLGSTPMWDCVPLQESLNYALRVLDDHVRKLIRPPVSADKLTPESELRKISEMLALPGAFWRNNFGSAITVEEVKPLDQAIYKLIEFCERKIKERIGIDELSQILGLRQAPEGQSLDKLMFTAAASIRLRSRMLELFHREQGMMWLYNVVQFWDARRKFRMLGRKSMRGTDYDADPATLVPVRPGDRRQWIDIAIEHVENYSMYIEPSSLLRQAAAVERAESLALFKLGAIDRRTLLENLDRQKIDEIEQRCDEELKKKLAMAAQAQALSGGGGGAGGPGPMSSAAPQRPMGGDPRGRPQSFETDPRINAGGGVESSARPGSSGGV